MKDRATTISKSFRASFLSQEEVHLDSELCSEYVSSAKRWRLVLFYFCGKPAKGWRVSIKRKTFTTEFKRIDSNVTTRSFTAGNKSWSS